MEYWKELADRGEKTRAIKACRDAEGGTLRLARAEVDMYLAIRRGTCPTCGGRFQLTKDYGDKVAMVCQALGIAPKAWQCGGRTLEGVPFWTVRKTEEECRSFVDQIKDKLSHLVFALYPEPTDSWALEVMAAAYDKGVRVEVSIAAMSWFVLCHWEGKPAGMGSGHELGPAMAEALAVALGPLGPLSAIRRQGVG